MKQIFAVTLALLAASPAAARDPILNLPIECTLGDDCFILQYVDTDEGPGAADFTCGPLSYDGHKGTDFAVTSFAAMEAGVRVLSSAPGVVRAVRDGMEDTGADDTPAVLLMNKECGNGVVLDHGGGWETQYCHLKKGSVIVEQGQRVTMGATLGRVGYSGMTQFPHVHISVRKDGKVVDPFNTDKITQCGQDDGTDDDLWATSPAYTPGGIVSVGMDIAVPEYDAVKSGDAVHPVLPAKADALVGWGLAYGGRTGDTLEVTITLPDGSDLIRAPQEVTRNQAMFFRAAGKRIPDAGWQTGDFTVTARLLREGEEIDSQTTKVRVEN